MGRTALRGNFSLTHQLKKTRHECKNMRSMSVSVSKVVVFVVVVVVVLFGFVVVVVVVLCSNSGTESDAAFPVIMGRHSLPFYA